ncbi:UV DNA damage repair endonuclease UvsE [Clostridium sp.]|jgi:UV DNA damage endonuclease|uniref:UV DNA damage repair endonuclease UvsE n=1 Tax=Clostridium sp. TaxID=1506 RepID=UPI003A3A7020
MRIGYACLAVGVVHTTMKRCILKNVNEDKLLNLTAYNLNSLENIIDYNIENNIKLFRISSNLIPFGSNSVNSILWWDIFYNDFLKIGEKIKENGIRVSMHPGQYTVLNSPNKDVVHRAIKDLTYHTRVLDTLGMKNDSKIVLHIGGVYNDKVNSIRRFITNYSYLDDSVKKRLVIENDHKLYNIYDVLEIGTKLNIPVIFDNLHNKVNPCYDKGDDFYWISECRRTWKENDGSQKIHYSQQDSSKRQGAHSSTIDIDEFIDFYKKLGRDDIDIMLEVKDKNLSAIKCINAISSENI